MNSVKLNRVELLSIVRTNKDKHEADYIEAVEDYKKAMVKIAEKNKKLALLNLKNMKAGQFEKIAPMTAYLTVPKSFLVEYSRAIRMLELSVEDHIDVEEDVFNQLVLDEWSWKQAFVGTMAMYKTLV